MSIASTVNAFNLMNLNGVDPFSMVSAPDATKNNWWEKAQKAGSTSQIPQYTGLMGGDYGRLEQNLRAPGDMAANTAYSTARRDLANASTGNGMYGSSMYTRQMVDQASSPYMQALTQNAANAAAKRYSMQQQDQQYKFGADLQANQAAYRDLMYNNGLLQAGYNDAWQRAQWDAAQRQQVWNAFKDYIQMTDEHKDSQEALAVSRASKANSSDSGMGGLMSGAGSLLGMGLSFIPGLGALGPVLGSAGTMLGQAGLSGVTNPSNWSQTYTPYL